MKHLYILLIILGFNTLNAQEFDAGDFEYLTISSDGDMTYYYKIEKHNNFTDETTLWLKTFIKEKSSKKKKGKVIKTKAKYSMSFITIDCGNRVYDAGEFALYDLTGNFIDSGNSNKFGVKIFPETIMAYLADIVCEAD